MKSSAEDTSPMISQLLYGEHFKVLERRKLWGKIRNAFDGCEGWVSNNQISLINETEYKEIDAIETPKYSSDLVSYLIQENSTLIPVVLGSCIVSTPTLPYVFDGFCMEGKMEKSNIVSTALMYLNAPYLLGGKTPFGLDCSGFTQLVYKLCGYQLFRNAIEQSGQGAALSFIEESEPGDLAFFDNAEGEIFHVGIIMKNNYIIHVHGKVRMDRLDHTGIFNTDMGNYTHNLRVIKKII
ncbi:NlpC/P60 family protein [Ulvibacterium sp.]|uniref:C40 family peptidase n=1 Tax=Ulvibacterium sp. TaxID=2665914 RepID=UPI003CC6B698